MSSETEHIKMAPPTSMKGRDYVHQTLRHWLAGNAIRPTIRDDVSHYLHVQRIGGLLYHIDGVLSEANTQLCRSIWRQNTARYLNQIAGLRLLSVDAIKNSLAVKGVDYAENLYTDPGARQSADLDLLASSITRVKIEASVPSDVVRTTDSCSVGLEIAGCLIEIHNIFAPQYLSKLDWTTLISNGRPRTIDGLKFRFPRPLDRLNIWLVNQAKASFVDGLWAYVDLALILKELLYSPSPFSWAQLQQATDAFALGLAFKIALARLEQFDIWPFEPIPSPDRRTRLLRACLTTNESPNPLPNPIKRQGLQFALSRPGFRAQCVKTVVKKLKV